MAKVSRSGGSNNGLRAFLIVCLAAGSVLACHRQRGSLARAAQAQKPVKLRLMTYNILGGGGKRAGLIRSVIAQEKPDILALNECNGWHRENAKLLREYAAALGMNAVMAVKHGANVVLLVKRDLPILEVLSDTERQGHGLLVVKVEAPDGRPLKVIATHMMHTSPDVRLKEMREIVRYIGAGERCVVMGDLNSISPHDEADLELVPESQRKRFAKDGKIDTTVIERLESAGMIDAYRLKHPEWSESDRTVGTAISKDPAHARARLRLDYIFVSLNLADGVERAEILNTDLTNRASDHFPVVVDLAVR